MHKNTIAIQRCIQALQAAALVCDAYSTASKEGGDRIRDIANMLAMGDDGHGIKGGIQTNIADALCRGLLGHERVSS